MTKRHENVNATPATAQLRQKVRVAAVALRLFYFCDTSNEILTKMTSESKSPETIFELFISRRIMVRIPQAFLSQLHGELKINF